MRRVTDMLPSPGLQPPSPARGRGGGGESRQSGLTLVEMIVAIVVGGILISMTSLFVRGQIQSYFDVSNRAALADDADTAVRRIAREIGAALPNSVRVHASGCCLEFIPIRDAGRYRAEIGMAGDRALDFGTAGTATEFDVLGPTVRVDVGDRIVVYNLGQPGADVYNGDTIRTPNGTGPALNRISAATAFQFPLASPGSRFQVVQPPVSYVCRAGTLRKHWGYALSATQPDNPGGSSALLADNASCTFSYLSAVLQRNALVSIQLVLARNDESVTLQQQIEVNNTP